MADGIKTCSRCGEAKPLEEFYRDKYKSDGRESRCKACKSAYNASRKEERQRYHREYYLANKEAILKRTGEYQKADPERTREYWRRYQVANRELLAQRARDRRSADPEHERMLGARFRERHPEKARRDAHRRRAALGLVEYDPTVTTESLRERDGDYCCYCGQALDFVNPDQYAANRPTIEHITPISRGGGHVFGNTALACRACNVSKYNLPLLWEWLARRT